MRALRQVGDLERQAGGPPGGAIGLLLALERVGLLGADRWNQGSGAIRHRVERIQAPDRVRVQPDRRLVIAATHQL